MQMNSFAFGRLVFHSAVIVFALAVSTSADESESVRSTVDAFHEALGRGDGAAAIKLLAPDALILEGGSVETRAEYESHHLAADIEFAKAVPSPRSDVRVQIDGNTAWLTSRSRTEGEFKGRPVNSSGAELIVLTKTPEGWRIRAIHWSSHKVTKAE
jgi:ketosteroid isomerase-like protein